MHLLIHLLAILNIATPVRGFTKTGQTGSNLSLRCIQKAKYSLIVVLTTILFSASIDQLWCVSETAAQNARNLAKILGIHAFQPLYFLPVKT